MKFFKLEAEYDTLYIRAETLAEAQEHIDNLLGEIPRDLMTWTEIDEDDLPEDQVWLEFEEIGDDEDIDELYFGDDEILDLDDDQ